MPTIQEVRDYLSRLPNTEPFDALPAEDQDKVIFAAQELLSDLYPARLITPRVVALQTLFGIEGEDEEFARLRRQGVKSYSTKRASVTFEGGAIAPDVVGILGAPYGKGGTARLV